MGEGRGKQRGEEGISRGWEEQADGRGRDQQRKKARLIDTLTHLEITLRKRASSSS